MIFRDFKNKKKQFTLIILRFYRRGIESTSLDLFMIVSLFMLYPLTKLINKLSIYLESNAFIIRIFKYKT